MAVAEDMYVVDILRVVEEFTTINVKDLEFLLCQIHAPWTKSEDGDVRFVFEEMKRRMIYVFDSKSQRCNFQLLAKYMMWIHRDDLGHKLRDLGIVNRFSVQCCNTIRYDTIEEFNVDSKAEYRPTA